jgi:hypothetical protein
MRVSNVLPVSLPDAGPSNSASDIWTTYHMAKGAFDSSDKAAGNGSADVSNTHCLPVLYGTGYMSSSKQDIKRLWFPGRSGEENVQAAPASPAAISQRHKSRIEQRYLAAIRRSLEGDG